MTRLESIRNNAFLLGLNMTRATKEQKIQWLCQIIDNETDKPEDEMDFALIGECSAYLRELSEKAAEATKEQKRRILQQIKAHHNQTAQKSAKVLRPSWKTPRKIIAIAATIVLLLAITLTVIAKVNG
jgi:thiamine pyrophosphate-dependent acetolactate synthase large subunit-like protein